MKIGITVTEANINSGVRICPARCPVALALRETTGMPWLVETRRAYLRDGTASINLPKKVEEFIRAFDTRQPVSPIYFFLDTEE